jgi:hypothetical protein
VSPEELLEAAERLVREASSETSGMWPRAAALLARQALETAMKIRISTRIGRVEELSFQSQLLCLHDFTDADTARRTAAVWSALTTATHHHGYELPPTAAALEGWLDAARGLVRGLGG